MSGSIRDEGPAREVSLAPNRSGLRACGACAFPSILVTIICISATAAYETAHDGNPVVPVDWKSVSDENLLYYYIYNPGKLDYSRFEWGGTVLHPGDKGARTSLDPDHLTLPVFAFDEVDIADRAVVKERLSALFPDISIDGMTVESRFEDGRLDCISFWNATVRINLERSGRVDYHQYLDFSTIGPDIVGSNESARAIAFDYLACHGGVPSDIGYLRMWHSGQENRLQYSIRIERDIRGLPTLFDGVHGSILMYIDGRTGRVMSMHRGWPEARLAFYVTDLPRPASIVRYHGLNATAFEVGDWDPLENLTYLISDQVFFSPVPAHAGTTFMLPHWVAYEKEQIGFWPSATHYCNAVFPDETVSS